jgi:hypothetical protein
VVGKEKEAEGQKCSAANARDGVWIESEQIGTLKKCEIAFLLNLL